MNELAGNKIKEFVTGGPKNYALKLTKPQDDGTTTCCKVRGITLNHKMYFKSTMNY